MAKSGKHGTSKRGGGKRSKKTVRARDLVAKRGGTAKGGLSTKYTMFLADGTPGLTKEPTSLEFPN
jgi:hypothetical protein